MMVGELGIMGIMGSVAADDLGRRHGKEVGKSMIFLLRVFFLRRGNYQKWWLL